MFDDITREQIKECNPNYTQTPGHRYRLSIVGGFRSGRTKALINLINHQPAL